MLSLALLLCLASTVIAENDYNSDQYQVLQFENFGFPGYYYDVISMDASEDTCTSSCELSTDRTDFSGSNSPLNEEVSVHFRGPLKLHEFGYYITDDFSISGSNSGSWTREASYIAANESASNVTFMGNHGSASSCLGAALSYLNSSGSGASSSSTVLESDNLVLSDVEYSIYSSVKCGDSSTSGDCGYYRSGIPAYHGFYGTTKMFLFTFEMPKENQTYNSDYGSYNMPAIWLLNAKIPRTAQYPISTNCSCWTSGCGEFDIFEVMNYTHPLNMFTTIHDWQGVEYIAEGIEQDANMARTYNSVMKGGLILDSDGTATVFMNNDTSVDEEISFDTIRSYISGKSADATTLATISSAAAATSTSSSKANAAPAFSVESSILAGIVGLISLLL